MKIVHISDSHGAKYHEKINTPECDVLVHTGDIGGRTNILELNEFLIWLEKQPARVKIFIGGNHDIVLDKTYPQKDKDRGNTFGWSRGLDEYKDSQELIAKYNVKYLNNTDYVYEGVKFYGSPFSPSFHRDYWAFNADRGEEIRKVWAKIPSDVNVLLTHTPVYGILDDVKEYAHLNEDVHVGCKDLLAVIKKRLLNLKLHCAGHIHDQYGVLNIPVTNTRHCLFSNGAVINNEGRHLIKQPLIITI